MAATDTFRLGLDARLYYLPNASRTGANWTTGTFAALKGDMLEMTNVRDLTLNLTKTTADITTRGSGFREQAGVLKEATVTFGAVWDPSQLNDATDATNEFLKAFLNTHSLDGELGLIMCAILDDEVGTTGAQGVFADFCVTGFTRNENLEEALMIDVELVASRSTNPVFTHPAWVVES